MSIFSIARQLRLGVLASGRTQGAVRLRWIDEFGSDVLHGVGDATTVHDTTTPRRSIERPRRRVDQTRSSV